MKYLQIIFYIIAIEIVQNSTSTYKCYQQINYKSYDFSIF